MIQLIFYPLFLLTGVALTVFLYRLRLKKISVDLNQKLDKVFLAIIPNTPIVPGVQHAHGTMEDFSFIGNKIERLSIPAKISEPIVQENNLTEKSDLKKRFDHLQVVNEFGQRVTSSLRIEDTFQHLYEAINSIMDAAVFELGIYSWRENNWKIHSNLELTAANEHQENAYRNHMAEWSLQNNREVLLEDAEKDYERYVFQPLVLPDGRKPQSILIFPVYQQEKEVGTLSVMSFTKNAFNEYHISMIRSLLPYTGVAIGNALVHQELINTQTQLIHNEKMASLGQIASGIAHEILNPLNFVNNFSKLSIDLLPEIAAVHTKEEQLDLKNQLVNNLDKIHHHGQRAYMIVKNMMSLGRTGNRNKTKIDVNRAIEGYLNIAVSSFKNIAPEFTCRIEKGLDSKITTVDFVSEDFGSLMLHLFNNALYTMNEKSKKVNSTAASVTAYEPELIIRTNTVNSTVMIMVKDNGMGIPDEIKGKIFLPFFTTKPTGQGTGLGLSLSHDIVTKGHKGELTVKSETGSGSEFRIALPLNAI